MVYLDNAATTFPKPDAVYDAMDQMNRHGAVNPGRGSYRLAKDASKLIDDTKKELRNLVHTDISSAVVFAPSITIALNQIAHGLNLREKAVVYVSPYEHNAVARSLHNVAKQKNLIIKEIPINSGFEIDLESMKYEFIKDKPEAVFCNHMSNVNGYILPVEIIFAEAKKYGSINVLDTAQSLGLIDVRTDLLSVDVIAFAGHKSLYGPLGIGGFINVTGIPLEPFISGGTGSDSLNLEMPNGSEAKYEAASTNIVAIAGLNAALKEVRPFETFQHEKELSEYLISQLAGIKEVKLFLPSDLEKHVGIVSCCIEGYDSEDVGLILDEDFDIAVRTGYHCAPFIHKYFKDEEMHGTIRISLGQFSTKKDIDCIIKAIKDLLQ
jgi:cysteine desulfurase family protein